MSEVVVKFYWCANALEWSRPRESHELQRMLQMKTNTMEESLLALLRTPLHHQLSLCIGRDRFVSQRQTFELA